MKQKERDGRKKRLTEGAANGAVALIFLIIGFQLAIFVMKVLQRPAAPEAVVSEMPEARRDSPAGGTDKPSRESPAFPEEPQKSPLGGYKTPATAGTTAAVVESRKPRRVESFRFNPNTVTREEGHSTSR